jgi:hypothetical protein
VIAVAARVYKLEKREGALCVAGATAVAAAVVVAAVLESAGWPPSYLSL